jgi:signal recognition particle subunit SRP54
MFESLTDRLGDVFDRLRKRGALNEADVTAALREVRVALLEADVALPVVKDFINSVRDKAIGQDVIRSVTPGQMVVKIVHDHLVEMLGTDSVDISLRATPPVPDCKARARPRPPARLRSGSRTASARRC